MAKLAKGEVPDPTPEPEEDEAIEDDPEDDPRDGGEAKWEEILAGFDRPLLICDLDFTDLYEEPPENAGI